VTLMPSDGGGRATPTFAAGAELQHVAVGALEYPRHTRISVSRPLSSSRQRCAPASSIGIRACHRCGRRRVPQPRLGVYEAHRLGQLPPKSTRRQSSACLSRSRKNAASIEPLPPIPHAQRKSASVRCMRRAPENAPAEEWISTVSPGAEAASARAIALANTHGCRRSNDFSRPWFEVTMFIGNQ